MFDKLARHGGILVVVDQPASIGALPVAVAQACGHEVAYLPGLAMRRIADLHPGAAKTDTRDGYVIAAAARTLPHTLRRVDVGDETLAELEVLVGFDDDLAGEATRVCNRIRGLLTQIHPALERALGPRVQHPAVLEPLSRCGGPAGLRKAGRSKLLEIASKNAPRMGERLVEQIMTALDEQTVTVAGTTAAEKMLPRLANSLREVLLQRDQVPVRSKGSSMRTLLPGPDLDARHRCQDRSPDPARGRRWHRLQDSRTPGRLRWARPVTRRSGITIRGEHPPKGGNKQLKRAFVLTAFASLTHPPSRGYYDRKRAQGKRHKAALICLARRRCDVLFAMLRDQAPYQVRPTKPAVAA